MRMLPPDLAEQLEIIAMEYQRGGGLPGPSMAKSIARDVTALLHRRPGWKGVRVQAEFRDRGLYVHLLVPAEGRRVERLVVSMGEY